MPRADNVSVAGFALCALFALSCGSTAESPNVTDPDAAMTAPAIDAAPGSATFATLVETTWTLPSGTEDYLCVRRTVTEDLLIDRFEPIGPLGTHHTVLGVGAPTGPDGTTSCNSTVLSPQIIYVSGVNTPAMDLPENVVMRVQKGE